MHVKNKKFNWLNKYILKVQHLLPNFHKLKRITISYAKRNTLCKTYGALTRCGNCYNLSIKVNLTRASDYQNQLQLYTRSLTKIEVLCTLAHELAHLEHWTHTPEHKKLESRITALFMTILHNSGYIDEEAELKKLDKLDRLKDYMFNHGHK